MSRIQLLLKAKGIIETQLNKFIITTEFNESASKLKIVLKGGITLFIRYNDYEEYSYTLQFSLNKFDRIRFDNFDKIWGVETDPHHVHPRLQKKANKSDMTGNPDKDMPIFIKVIVEFLNVQM